MSVARLSTVALSVGSLCLAGWSGCGGLPTQAPDDDTRICMGAEPTQDGSVQYSASGCTEYQPGTVAIVISAPHGGYQVPNEFDDRTQGTTVNDGVTQELCREVADAIEGITGGRPALIINRLDRVKLDPNRDIDEAAEGSPLAEAEWAAYHGFVETALGEIRDRGQIGFYVDLHGQSHDPGRSQLGFSTTASNMELSDPVLNNGGYAEWSSLIPHVASSSASFADLLRGPTSLGGRLAAAGHRSVPSPDDPSPGSDVTYWNTGYSSYTHGPLQGVSWVSSVLLETAYDGVRDTPRHRQAFANDLAKALVQFMADHGTPLVDSGARASGDTEQ